jgi:hypothetical protein
LSSTNAEQSSGFPVPATPIFDCAVNKILDLKSAGLDLKGVGLKVWISSGLRAANGQLA